MTDPFAPLRTHVVRLLTWEEAHVGLERAAAGIPPDLQGARAGGVEHTAWQLLEHVRIAQRDLLDFCVNTRYEHALEWPARYWPATEAPPTPRAWDESLAAILADRGTLCRLAQDPAVDLFARVPAGKDGQTILRALLLVADHNAYHAGQMIDLRRALGIWP